MEATEDAMKNLFKMETTLDKYDIVVVGSGLFGLTVARLAAENLGLRVLVIEKRSHIGGNAWSDIDPETGIEVHKYGSHLFHTSNLRVWNFVARFTDFREYRHTVFARVNNATHSLPINLTTLSSFFGRDFSPTEAEEFFKVFSDEIPNPKNFEEKIISKIGIELYQAFYKGYSEKQWGIDPKLLPSEMASRLPIRTSRNNRYFKDQHEGLPSQGYANFLKNLAHFENIDVLVNTDFFELKSSLNPSVPLVYTGPIDAFYGHAHGKLGWRTLDFETTSLEMRDFQGTAVINFPDIDIPYTRIHEYKHLGSEENFHETKTIISKEFSRFSESGDEPYYPINSDKDRIILEKYRLNSKQDENIIFGGRLGSYKYLDMDMAIASALVTFENKIVPRFLND